MSAEGILDDPALFWGQHAERGKLLGTLAAADDDAAPASTSSPSPSPSSPSPEPPPPPPPFDLLTRLPPAPPKHHPCFETAEAAASAAAASAAAAGAATTATTTATTTAETTTTTTVGDRPSRLKLAVEYLELVKRFPVKQSSVRRRVGQWVGASIVIKHCVLDLIHIFLVLLLYSLLSRFN
jgi:hypothetical protein